MCFLISIFLCQKKWKRLVCFCLPQTTYGKEYHMSHFFSLRNFGKTSQGNDAAVKYTACVLAKYILNAAVVKYTACVLAKYILNAFLIKRNCKLFTRGLFLPSCSQFWRLNFEMSYCNRNTKGWLIRTNYRTEHRRNINILITMHF